MGSGVKHGYTTHIYNLHTYLMKMLYLVLGKSEICIHTTWYINHM